MVQDRIYPILVDTYDISDFHPIKSVPNKESRNTQPVQIVLGKPPRSGNTWAGDMEPSIAIDNLFFIVVLRSTDRT
jgi:hypothetical protein